MSESNNPYAGISSQRLVDLINTANNSQLAEGVDFRFGVPRAISNAEGFNTRVRLYRLNTRYSADIDVEYTRRPLEDLNDLPEGFIRPVAVDSGAFWIHDVLDAINNALGLDLLESEVENEFFPAVQETYPLTIKEGSLAWLPKSVYHFKIDTLDLKDVVAVSVLDGLYPPDHLP